MALDITYVPNRLPSRESTRFVVSAAAHVAMAAGACAVVNGGILSLRHRKESRLVAALDVASTDFPKIGEKIPPITLKAQAVKAKSSFCGFTGVDGTVAGSNICFLELAKAFALGAALVNRKKVSKTSRRIATSRILFFEPLFYSVNIARSGFQ